MLIYKYNQNYVWILIMKMKQAFKDIEQPEDINQEELNAYLGELYGESRFDINDPRYNSENREFRANWDNFVYKQQVDKIITEVVRLSELEDFKHLKKHYVSPISPGASRIAADEEKTFIELTCFKLAKRREKVNFIKFKDEVKASTLHKCIGGAARNMQMIFFSMEQVEYYQKYNFISHIALEYTRNKKLVIPGNEPHAVNKLIHEVSRTYNLVPPRDNHSTYRNLEDPVPGNMARYAEFYPYLDTLMDTREGVYSYVSFLANDLMSKLPTIEDLNLEEENLPIGEDTSSKSILKINDFLEEYSIKHTEILNEDSAGNYAYKDDYQELIEAIIMQKLVASQMVDFVPIKSADKEVVETPSAWYLVSKNQDNTSYRKVLDSKILQGLTKDGKNIEDYIHAISKKLTLNDSNNFEDRHIKSLFFRSDQAKELIKWVKQDYLNSLPNDEFRQWIKFSRELQHSVNRSLMYVFKYGNIEMYNCMCKVVPMRHRSKMFTHPFLDMCLKAGNNSLFQACIEKKDANLDQVDKKGNTLLHIAVIKGNIDAVVALIRHGANQEIKNHIGETPIYEALTREKLDIVHYMIEKGANISISFMKRAIYSHVDIVQLVFDKNPELANLINDGTENIFPNDYSAGNYKYSNMYECLLDNGVSPYSLDSSGLSEFMKQCSNNDRLDDTKRLEILLDKGFDPKRESGNLIHNKDPSAKIYHSAFDYCKKIGHMKAIDLMLSKNAINQSDLEYDCFNKEKIDVPFNAGRTYLQFAVSHGFRIKTLIDAGANLNYTNKLVGTAMHYAASHNNHIALQQLLDAGADYSIFNKAGNPALHHAIKSNSVESVRILLESTDPNIKNNAEQNALEYFDSLKDKQKKSKLGKEIKKLLDNKALERASKMIEVEPDIIDSIESSMVSSVESSSSWQQKINRKLPLAEEEKESPNPKRVRGNSFSEREESKRDDKEHSR